MFSSERSTGDLLEAIPINQGRKPKSGRDLRICEGFEEDPVCFAGPLQDPVTSGTSKKTGDCFDILYFRTYEIRSWTRSVSNCLNDILSEDVTRNEIDVYI
jgi:hypothetical protein